MQRVKHAGLSTQSGNGAPEGSRGRERTIHLESDRHSKALLQPLYDDRLHAHSEDREKSPYRIE